MDKAEYLKNNRGLINKLASKYYISTPKFDFDDLVSIGNKAAIHALDMFDESKGKVTTYVGQAVKREIRDFVSKNKHDLYVSAWGQRESWKAIQRGESDPLTNTIALRINWNDDSDSGNASKDIGYVAIPSGEPPVDEVLIKKEQIDILMDELNALPERDRQVIHSRFFDGETLIQIANRLNLTKQRINQIECRAINTLKRRLTIRGLTEIL